MSHLDTLITRHLKELSGAEFKLAVYQYRRLQRRAEVMDTIDSLAKATGLSWRQTQAALRSLAKKGILQVEGRQKHGTRCSLPHTSARSQAKSIPTRPDRTRRKMVTNQAPQSIESVPAEAKASSRPTPAVQLGSSVATAPPSSQELEQKAKAAEAQRLACKLMDMRGQIDTKNFNLLLQCADGDLDRLLARLQRLAQRHYNFDNFLMLCAQVSHMVVVR
jgi:hypothetical protein